MTLISIISYRYKRQIKELNNRFDKTADTLNGGVITVAVKDELYITSWNNGFLKLVGYSEQDFAALKMRPLINFVCDDDRSKLREAVKTAVDTKTDVQTEIRILNSDGHNITVSFSANVSGKGSKTLLYGVMLDLTSHNNRIEQMRMEQERYLLIVEQSNDILFDASIFDRTINYSQKAEKIFGWGNSSADENTDVLNEFYSRIHPDDNESLKKIIHQIMMGSREIVSRVRIRKKDGTYLWCDVNLGCISSGGKTMRVVGKITDVDAQVKERAALQRLSQTDRLTGLLNKEAFRFFAEKYLALPEARCAIMFIDIDNFKRLNDTMGHVTGDEALKTIAIKLHKAFRNDDIIGRFGGDEFYVLAKHLDEPSLSQKIEALNRFIKKTYTNDDKSVTISASIGVARVPNDGKSFDEILVKSDKALYCAKERGKDCFVLYDDNLVLTGYENKRK